MPFTDKCDLYVALHEEGINRVVRHIMRQRPSLFNYATADVVNNKELWCSPVDFTNDVQKYFNPIFTVKNPLPVLGADSPPVTLSFCAQLTKAELDFHPGNTIVLPPELNPPLKDQRFSMQFQICGAIGCPYDKDVDSIQPTPPPTPKETGTAQPPPVNLKGKLNCFCLNVFVIGHFERVIMAGKESLLGKIDDIRIDELKPDRLERNIACYIKTAVNVVLREKLTIPIEKLSLSFPLFNIATITLSPSPNPPISNNPAIEDDQLKVFMDMKVTP